MPLFLAPPEGFEKILAPADILLPLVTKGALWDMYNFVYPKTTFFNPTKSFLVPVPQKLDYCTTPNVLLLHCPLPDHPPPLY